MRKLFAIVALAFLAGCGVQPLKTGKVDPGMSELQVKAQSIINESYRLLAAADREIGQAAADRIWPSADAQKYLDQAIEYRKHVDGWQRLLDKGDVGSVLQSADAQNAILDEFLKAVVAKAAAARKAKPISWDEEPIFLSA